MEDMKIYTHEKWVATVLRIQVGHKWVLVGTLVDITKDFIAETFSVDANYAFDCESKYTGYQYVASKLFEMTGVWKRRVRSSSKPKPGLYNINGRFIDPVRNPSQFVAFMDELDETETIQYRYERKGSYWPKKKKKI
jgi:hypothetical protein